MKSLAQAVVESAAFLELSGDDIVNPDAAVRALESISSAVGDASEEEEKALLAYCRESATAIADPCTPLDRKRREFYLEFADVFGLTGD